MLLIEARVGRIDRSRLDAATAMLGSSLIQVGGDLGLVVYAGAPLPQFDGPVHRRHGPPIIVVSADEVFRRMADGSLIDRFREWRNQLVHGKQGHGNV
jgi:hypothetical protein